MVGFPAFAVDDPELIALTRETIKEKLEVKAWLMYMVPALHLGKSKLSVESWLGFHLFFLE